MLKKNKISIPWLSAAAAFLICLFLILPPVLKKHPLFGFFKIIPKASAPEPKKEITFVAPALSAKAAVVYDTVTKQELFSLNPEAQLPLASLTKIMTALIARERLSPEDSVVIGEKTLKADGDGLLKSGDRWSLGKLLDWTLVRSSNDGAVAIASAWEAVAQNHAEERASSSEKRSFVAEMNKNASTLGLTQTYFLNETGLDLNKEVSGAYGSARDVSRLFSTAVREYPETFEATRYKDLTLEEARATYKTKNTNGEAETIPGLIASKTGFTDLAGGNLVILFDAGPNHPIAISVLGSTEKGRFEDVSSLAKEALVYMKAKGEAR